MFTALRNKSTKGQTSEIHRPLEIPEAGSFILQKGQKRNCNINEVPCARAVQVPLYAGLI